MVFSIGLSQHQNGNDGCDKCQSDNKATVRPVASVIFEVGINNVVAGLWFFTSLFCGTLRIAFGLLSMDDRRGLGRILFGPPLFQCFYMRPREIEVAIRLRELLPIGPLQSIAVVFGALWMFVSRTLSAHIARPLHTPARARFSYFVFRLRAFAAAVRAFAAAFEALIALSLRCFAVSAFALASPPFRASSARTRLISSGSMPQIIHPTSTVASHLTSFQHGGMIQDISIWLCRR